MGLTMHSKLSIAGKLYAIFGFLAAVTVAAAVVAVINADRHVALTKEFESAFNGAENVERVDGLIYAVVMESRGIYMSSDIETARQFAAGLTLFNDRIGSVVEEWQKSILPEDAKVFAAFSERVKKFQEFRRELVRRGTEISPEAGREWGDNDANRTVRTALNNDLETLGKLYAQRSRQIYAQIESAIWTTASAMAVLGAFALTAAIIGALIIHRSIAKPLAAVTHITESVAGGNAVEAVPYRERNDEVGALARSISVFQDAMQRNIELNRTIASDAEAKARTQQWISLEIDKFGTEIEASLSELGQLFDRMLAAADLLTEGADIASAKTISATKASSEASGNVGEIALAAEELARSVAEIESQVAQSSTITNQAISEAEQGNASVKELNESRHRIGDVIKLITDIAEQTNLLALNATIEAARAGEAGRGFAVVANEVKALSSQTAKATGDIGTQIAAMQSATLRSIHAIESIERTILQIGEISGAMSSAVTAQGVAIHEIARNAEVAARRTDDTAAEVSRVGEATENTRDSAKSVKALADDLAASAAEIRSHVDQFFQKLRAA